MKSGIMELTLLSIDYCKLFRVSATGKLDLSPA